MATGTITQPFGVAATGPAGAGIGEWTRMSGVAPINPIVGGPGRPDDPMSGPYSVHHGTGRIVSQDTYAAAGPMAGAGLRHLGDWRDALNPQSPLMWLMLLTIIAVGMVQLQVRVRAGGKRGVAAAIQAG